MGYVARPLRSSIPRPLLVIVAIVLLSSAVVYVLVPLGQHFGLAFNQVARRQKKREAARRRLCSAVEDGLSKAGLGWEDLVQSGALDISLAQLHEAAHQPDAFLRNAVASSPSLLAKALDARAAASNQEACARELAELAEQSEVHFTDLATSEGFEDLETFLADAYEKLKAARRAQSDGRQDGRGSNRRSSEEAFSSRLGEGHKVSSLDSGPLLGFLIIRRSLFRPYSMMPGTQKGTVTLWRKM